MRHLSARRTLSAALVLALGLSLAASCAQKQEEPEQTFDDLNAEKDSEQQE